MMNIRGFLLIIAVVGVYGQLTQDGVTKLMERISALESEVTNMKHELKMSKEQCKCTEGSSHKTLSERFVMENEGPVAFTAAIKPSTVDHVHANTVVKFDTIITNIGGGYNNITGIFVVPVSGIYVFSSSLLDHYGEPLQSGQTHGTTMIHAEIRLNQRLLGRIFAHAESLWRDQGAQTVFVHANQGDQVYVRVLDNDDLGLGGDYYSTFSGCLLYAM